MSHYVTLNQLGQEQSVEAVTPNLHSSQLSGRVELWPAVTFSKTCLMHRPVSTDSHFMKLNYLLNTLHILVIMHVYDFVPFIFNTCYLLFCFEQP